MDGFFHAKFHENRWFGATISGNPHLGGTMWEASPLLWTSNRGCICKHTVHVPQWHLVPCSPHLQQIVEGKAANSIQFQRNLFNAPRSRGQHVPCLCLANNSLINSNWAIGSDLSNYKLCKHFLRSSFPWKPNYSFFLPSVFLGSLLPRAEKAGK